MSTHKTEQLKWVYGGFAGICLAFLLTLLGSNQQIDSSTPLLLASIGFGVCLPIFTVFTLVHVVFLEEQRCSEEIELALSATWVKALTQLAIFLFVLSIASMLLHISRLLFVASLASTVFMSFAFIKFRSSLRGKP